LAWKIWKDRADDISLPGNAFSWASLRMLKIVSTSGSFGKRRAEAARRSGAAQKQYDVE
jgi:hypothetical protein